MRKALSFILISMIIFSVAACHNNRDKVVLYYSFEGKLENLDPQLANNENSFLLIENIFEGLIRIDSKNRIYSETCKEYFVSDNLLSYTFILKDNLLWSDKQKMTSDDFRFGIERALNKSTKSPYADTLFAIKNAKEYNSGKVAENKLGIETPDEQTIIFHLSKPDPNFLTVLSAPLSMPCNRTFFAETKGKYGLSKDMALSNGAFTVTKLIDEVIHLNKNENYILSANVIPSIIYIYLNEENEVSQKNFLEGKRDIVEFSGSDYSKFDSNKYNIYSYSNITYGILFNFNDDIVKNDYFRKMVTSSIDLDENIQNLSKEYAKAEGIIPPACYCGQLNYRESAKEITSNYSLEEAKKANQTFLSQQTEELPKLDIIYLDNPNIKKVVTQLVHNCQKEFYIFINPTPLSQVDFEERLSSGNYQMAFIPMTSTDNTPLNLLSIFKSNSNSPNGFKDKKFDELFDQIPPLSDENSIAAIYECEKYLVNTKNAFFPVTFANSYYAMNKTLKNVQIKPSGGNIDFRFISR